LLFFVSNTKTPRSTGISNTKPNIKVCRRKNPPIAKTKNKARYRNPFLIFFWPYASKRKRKGVINEMKKR
jgi:hypothetical protein